VEHVIAQQHLVDDNLQNLALACDRCNAFKGPNLSSVDPVTNAVVHLFHPRIDDWKEHFELVDGTVVGLTPVKLVATSLSATFKTLDSAP
jgi:hypothetical protein